MQRFSPLLGEMRRIVQRVLIDRPRCVQTWSLLPGRRGGIRQDASLPRCCAERTRSRSTRGLLGGMGQALALAIFGRLEVLGLQRMEFELTSDVIELGMDSALRGAIDLGSKVGEFGRGERI